MPVRDIYSKRAKRSRDEVPDVYQYDTIPKELRTQVVHIMSDVSKIIGENTSYESIHKTLCREYGLFTLFPTSHGQRRVPESDLVRNFFLQTDEIEKAIDVIELFFQEIDQYVSNSTSYVREKQNNLPDNERAKRDELRFLSGITEKCRKCEEAIDELNQRFREHGVGYQYESGQIIRADSQIIHSEAVQPALKMLSNPMYKGANAEFLSAHKHYRAKDYKPCMNECLKAFESCLKSICDARGWTYSSGDTANRLIEIVFKQKLIPDFMQSHFSALRSTLESGVPTARNRRSGHGQGPKIVEVPEHIAAYVLHLTASNILLFAKANEDMKQ